ncbi:MAG TPA: hypothetical protein VE032_02235 [Actinomycetota bacterium]|nr:hypothetical protein [Actinomycetota bacterium]
MTGDPVVQLSPPLSDVAWSSAFVSQSLEVLFVCLREDGAHHLRPIHAPTLRLGWGPDDEPGAIVLRSATRYDLTPLLVHSTSWRHQEGRLILTYVAAVEPPAALSAYLTDDPVERADLARGDALGPPTDIDVTQVIEHAFRHLSWLVKDDAVVGDTLADWTGFLDRYEPEPFRAFGPAPG